MPAQPVFISFDFDHDESLRNLLVGQAKNPDSPFFIEDHSVKEAMTGDWQRKVASKIMRTNLTIIICGQYTHTAEGVAAELLITRDQRKPYFLLWGYADKVCTKPRGAMESDKMYKWTWDNLKSLIAGNR